jgi:transaldolase / glucose-6-phosphate isomerase
MAENNKSRLLQLLDEGQSVWLDSIRRGQIKSGELKQLIDEEGVRGETANPSIFEKAVGGSSDYDDQIRELANQGLDANAIYERIATDDVRMACDVFRPVYDQSDGADGFVSLEVSPKLAYDTQGTLGEVRRFWKIVDRPNLMIKIPGTPEGVPAIEQSLYEGMNINITLLFSVQAYEQVAWAYVRALERRAAEGKAIDRSASVASFFVSRIDTLADKLLDERLKQEQDPQKYEEMNDLQGKLAIANAKIAYELFEKIFAHPRFQVVQAKGARVQRPLWASTSTKNPAYPDVMYVDNLIGPNTVNTLPLETIFAFKDHGHVERTVDKDLDVAHAEIQRFEAMGLSLDAVTAQVLKEGVEKFDEALDQLLKVIEDKRAAMQTQASPRGRAVLGAYAGAVEQRLDQVKKNDLAARLWQREASPWTQDPERQEVIRSRLGWLAAVKTMKEQAGALKDFADEIDGAGFKHVLLLGMGGSSLAPEVMQYTFGIGRGQPNFGVLDTTDPATIREYLREMHPTDTLYLVSSKSGTTLETLSFYKYFYGHVHNAMGDKAGESFVAITDPGTSLERVAKERGFRRMFLNPPDIGGRYSALSYFGLVPAALMGIDLPRLLDEADEMMRACAPAVPANENPGVWLGTILAELYDKGRDKITFVLSPRVEKFGSWLEQLLAESTGKPAEAEGKGKGLVPIEGEPLGAPEVYGDDRVFVYIRLENDVDATLLSGPRASAHAVASRNDALDHGVDELEKAGHPVIRLDLKDVYSLGGEFFRWEFAAAVAGALMGINPFDEPNVAESKQNTGRMLDEYKLGCKLPEFGATCTQNGISLYWNKAQRKHARLDEYVQEFLDQTRPRDYLALMAYLTHSPATDKALTASRAELRAHYHAATTVGYGPRFLHSTGQLHKGGANEGVFIQITGTDAKDLTIPGEEYTFGVLKQAQAIGDLQALENHDRRAMRLHLAQGTDVSALQQLLRAALGAVTDAGG